jgi:hypothetical protein
LDRLRCGRGDHQHLSAHCRTSGRCYRPDWLHHQPERQLAWPTPSFDSLFETSTAGTSAATFDADFYRDDEADDAWDLLPRGTRGHFIIARFGGTGTANLPVATDEVEVWPVMVTSRTMANMSSNTVLTFTVSCSVNIEPDEAAIVAA